MRRIIGIIGLIISSIVFYNVVANNKAYTDWVINLLGDGFFGGVALVLSALSIICIMGFLFMIFNRPFHYWMLGGESKGRSVRYENIQDFINYRNGLMGGMSPENAARLMNDTAIIDQLLAGGYGQNTKETMSYINTHLGGLSPKSQIDFLRGYKD